MSKPDTLSSIKKANGGNVESTPIFKKLPDSVI
jgi:hypothetical protein